MYPHICLILLATCTPAAGDEGPTLMPAIRPVSASEPGPIAIEEPPILLMPRKLDDPPKATNVPVPTLPKPTPAAQGNRGAEALKESASKLQAEREALQNEMRQETDNHANTPKKRSDEAMKMRLRLAELLIQAGKQGREERPAPATNPAAAPVVEKAPVLPPSTHHATPHGTDSIVGHEKPGTQADHGKTSSKNLVSKNHDQHAGSENKSAPAKGTDAPPSYTLSETAVDPLSLAQALFRTGDYEGSLAIYLSLLHKEPLPLEKVMYQYMIASCYRKLGKYDQAYSLYLEVINSKRDEVLSECSVWQLDTMKWRKDLENRLGQIKQRRQAMEVKP